MKPVGYFKIWRELLEKPIWLKSTPEQKVILIVIIGLANWEVNDWEWRGEKLHAEKGQFVTSIPSIMKCGGKGISIQNVRAALIKFKKYEFLTYETNRQDGTLVTIENWDLYQSKETLPNSDNQHKPNTSPTPIKKVKKNKNNNTVEYSSDFEEFYELYPRSVSKKQTFINYKNCLLEEDITPEIILLATKNYLTDIEKHDTAINYVVISSNFVGKAERYKDWIKTKFVRKGTKV